MYAFEPLRASRGDTVLASTPVALLAVLLATGAGAAGLAAAGWLPAEAGRVAGIAAAHGALLATALAWARVSVAAQIGLVLAIAGAATAAAAHPLGAVAYVAPPCALALLARRGRLAALGLGGPVPWGAVAAGGLFGALLGAHLLASASLTLGRRARLVAPAELIAWIGYDAGANVLAAECFFRGALFARTHRRWPLAPAAALSTAACVARYLVDPLLPQSVGMVAGAVFYLAALGAGNCWLLARSGHLLPGLVAALLFFTAYRLLGTA